ncbi:MAG: lipopolysaccharide biosynthesis protein [Verrucomicrobiota bacterium]|nr:lipopolysaccharide biosynthesis protein [Verrucomicrobiota bacterium]
MATEATVSAGTAAPRLRAEVSAGEAPAKSGRFAFNLVSNVGKLGLTMVVGAWYVPFLVRQLGPAAYGLIPLTSMITSYMALVTSSLDTSVGRYLTISLGRKDDRDANTIFNVSLWGNVAIVALLALPAMAAIANVQHLVRIPPGYETATRWLFAGTVAAFFLNQIRSPFLVSCFSLNRLDLQNVVIVGETLTRVGLVACLFLLIAPRVEYVGAGILAGTAVSTFSAVWFWKALTPNLHLRLRDFDWTVLKNMCGTSGWVVISQVGLLLYLNIDLVLANRLFGPETSGRYAAVLQLALLLSTLGMTVGEVFAPTMYHKYARGNFGELALYLNRAIKFVGLVLALVVGLVCGFAEPLLRLWLGQAFGSLAPLLCLMAIPVCITLAMYPLYAVPLAANRVKVPGMVTLAIGVFNLALALLLAGVFGWGLFGIAAAGAFSRIVRNFIFAPLYGAAVLHQPYRTFYRQALPIIGALLATIGLGRLISWGWPISNWVDLGLAGLTVSGLFAVTTWLLLTSEERAALKEAAVRWRK